MRKMATAFLVFDIMAGLLFLGVCESRGQLITVDGAAEIEADKEPEAEAEIRKIAITFDDDVIIGLSQEISYKEAVSMI